MRGSGGSNARKRKTYKGWVNECITILDNCSSILLGILGDKIDQTWDHVEHTCKGETWGHLTINSLTWGCWVWAAWSKGGRSSLSKRGTWVFEAGSSQAAQEPSTVAAGRLRSGWRWNPAEHQQAVSASGNVLPLDAQNRCYAWIS